jgi:hypothetical protein
MKSLTVVALCMMLAVALWIGFGSRNSLAQEGPGSGLSAGKYPPDIRPDSLSRMPRPKRDDFTSDEDKQSFDRVLAFEAILREPSGALGPTGTRAWIPQLAEEYRKLGRMVHEKGTMEPKYVELAALVAIREDNNPAEWGGHAINGTKLLGAKVVEVIQKEGDPSGLEDKKAAVMIQFGRELFHKPKVSSKTFAEMEQSFGRRNTLDVTLLMGYYDQNAVLYRAYDQQRAPNAAEGSYPPW